MKLAKTVLVLLGSLIVAVVFVHAAGTTYYVSTSGSDSNSGTSQSTPWATLSKVNGLTFQPGDQILLKCGDIWSGSVGLKPMGSGASGSPITIGSYGTGNKPVINAASGTDNGVTLWNQQYWVVRDVEVRSANHNGVSIDGDAGKMTYIRVLNVTARDCSPALGQRKYDNCGIKVGSQRQSTANPDEGIVLNNAAYFEDVLVDGCTVTNCAMGIMIAANVWDIDAALPQTYMPNVNASIKNCTVTDVNGDGIVIFQTKDGVIENCKNCNSCRYNADGKATAGIWVWETVNVNVRFCESYDIMTSGRDRNPYDIDFDTSDCTFEYNYGHDCYGASILLCGPYQGNNRNTFRYSVFKNNDKNPNYSYCIVQFWDCIGSGQKRWLYNNSFVTTSAQKVTQGSENNTYWYNNILYHTVGIRYSGNLERNKHDYNCVYNIKNWPSETHLLVANPLFVDISNTGVGFCDGLKLQTTSPCINQGGDLTTLGVGITGMGGRDYWGNTAPLGGAYDIGANECR